MKVGASFSGDLTKRLEALPSALSRKVIGEALLDAAEPIRSMAASLAPRDEISPGPHLADNIIAVVVTEARMLDRVGREDEVMVDIGPRKTFFYGRFQELAAEYGGVHHMAHPFLRPAFDANQARALDRVRNGLWKALREAAPGSIGGRFE